MSAKHQSVVLPDLRLPHGTRVAVVPLNLYGYAKEQKMAAADAAYSNVMAAMLKAGFHVVERSLVEKAVQDFAHNKQFTKTAGVQGAVYQEEATDEERVIDLVEIGRTLNVRLIAAGSMQLEATMMESRVEARLRVTDVTTGEMISHCEGGGNPKVMDQCATSMATELATHVLAGFGLSPLSRVEPLTRTPDPSFPPAPTARAAVVPIGAQLASLRPGDNVRLSLNDSSTIEGSVVSYHDSLLWLKTAGGKVYKQAYAISAVEVLAK